MAEEAQVTGTPAAVEPSDLDKAKAAYAEELKRVTGTAAASKNLYTRNAQLYEDKIRGLQEQLGGGEVTEAPQQPQRPQQDHTKDNRMGLMEWKINHTDWREHETDVMAIINDPTRAQEAVTYDADGNLDYGKSYERAHSLVEIQKLREMKEATAAAKVDQKDTQEAQKLQATISGTTASETEETVEVSGLTSDQMIESGQLDIDPRDPPRKRNPEG